ncbi:MAG: hypothetical protein IIC29_09535, partial [Chloroflexi bacterium]|nr:hypothetical protein [Chloroflexota bacterium]
MAHAHLKKIEAETLKASGLLIGTLVGGMLVVGSFVVELPVVAGALFQSGDGIVGADGTFQIPYSQIIALIGASLLGAPLVWHALKCLVQGHAHMEELVALAVVAAMAVGEYQEAGIIAFFMVVSNLIETR